MEQFVSPHGGDEYSRAFASVRAAKNWFWWLILVALLVQALAFVLVRFVGVVDLDKLAEAKEPAAKVVPAVPAPKAPATTAPAEGTKAAGDADAWSLLLGWALPVSKFVAMGSAILLSLSLLLAANVSLVGRSPGVAGYVSAFFWSLLLCLFLVPWQQTLPGSSILCGATYNFGELTSQTHLVTSSSPAWGKHLYYYSRFVAYPVFVVLLWLMVQVKFGQGYRRMTLGIEEGPAAPITPSNEQKI